QPDDTARVHRDRRRVCRRRELLRRGSRAQRFRGRPGRIPTAPGPGQGRIGQRVFRPPAGGGRQSEIAFPSRAVRAAAGRLTFISRISAMTYSLSIKPYVQQLQVPYRWSKGTQYVRRGILVRAEWDEIGRAHV